MSDLIAVPLPDGRWLALAPEALREALDAAQSLGLGPIAAPSGSAAPGEPWLNSEQLQAVTGIHATNWEARAKAGEVPHKRVGKLLRFKLSDVEAAVQAPA